MECLFVHGCVLIRQRLFRHTRGWTWAGEDGKKSSIVSPRACGDGLDADARDAALSTFSMVCEMNRLFGKRGNFRFGYRSPHDLRVCLVQEQLSTRRNP